MQTFAYVLVERMQIHNIYTTDENGYSPYQTETIPPGLFAHILLTPEHLSVMQENLYAYRDANNGAIQVGIDYEKENAMKAEALARAKEGAWTSLREERNALLVKSDWTQLPDTRLTPAQKEAWAVYRDALRDLPALATDDNILDLEWPVPPAI